MLHCNNCGIKTDMEFTIGGEGLYCFNCYKDKLHIEEVKPFKLPIQKREATCHDCGNIWIKTYKNCKVKHPTCYKCKSKSTTIRRIKNA